MGVFLQLSDKLTRTATGLAFVDGADTVLSLTAVAGRVDLTGSGQLFAVLPDDATADLPLEGPLAGALVDDLSVTSVAADGVVIRVDQGGLFYAPGLARIDSETDLALVLQHEGGAPKATVCTDQSAVTISFDLAIDVAGAQVLLPKGTPPDKSVGNPVANANLSMGIRADTGPALIGSWKPVLDLSDLLEGEPQVLWEQLRAMNMSGTTVLAVYGGRLLAARPKGPPTTYGTVRIEANQDVVESQGDGLVARALTVTVDVLTGGEPDAQIVFDLDELRLTRGLVIRHSEGALTPANRSPKMLLLRTRDKAWIRDDPAEPFTLVIHDGRPAELSLDPGAPRLLFGTSGSPAATIFVPGVAETGDHTRRFEYDVAGQAVPGSDPLTRFEITPAGLDLTATPKLRDVLLTETASTFVPTSEINPLPVVETLSGDLAVTSGEYVLTVRGVGDLPYFQQARAFVDGAAASRGALPDASGKPVLGALAFRLTPDLERRWIDASGLLMLRDPDVWMTLGWDGATTWEQRSGVEGAMVLRTPEAFDGVAEPWLEFLFDDLELSFAQLDLKQFVLADGDLRGVAAARAAFMGLKLRVAEPIRITMFSVFWFELRDIEIAWNSIRLTGALGFDRGGVSFMAELLDPPLELSFDDGLPRLGFAGQQDDFTLKVAGSLDIQGRVKASMGLEYKKSTERQYLAGKGALDVKGLPPMGITFTVGRARLSPRHKWFPIISMFGTVDHPIQLYKGIVLREYGAGFGVNMVLRGLERGGAIDQAGLEAFVEDPETYPFPEPTDPSEWIVDHDRFMLVGRTYVVPAKTPKDPTTEWPYLVDAILTIDERFDIILTTNIWAFTSLNDAKTTEFRQNPAARGALAMYPRNLTIEGHFRTLKEPEFTGAMQVLRLAMNHATGNLSFFASPDRLFVQLGPFNQPMPLGPFRAQSTFTVMTEVTSDGVVGLASIGLRGHEQLSAEIGTRIGPISVSAGFSVSARFGLEAVFAGGYATFGSYGRVFALYARFRMHLSGELTLWLAIAFELDLGFWTIRIRKRWSFHISISFDASLAGALMVRDTDDGATAVRGDGRLTVNLMGFELKFSVGFSAGEQPLLDDVEHRFATTLDSLVLA